MLDVDGEWENIDLLNAEHLLAEVRPEMKRAMKDALLLFEGAIKEKLTGTRTGRTYRVPVTKSRGTASRVHVASAPGEPPAVLFGNLRNSVGHVGPHWVGVLLLEGEVGPGLGQAPEGGEPDPSKAYARRLELGGSHTHEGTTVKIEARPYMEPAAMETEPKIDRLWRRRLET